MRPIAAAALSLIFAASLLSGWLVQRGYDEQFREAQNAAPSRQFVLGADELGRDRFARLLYGTRISLLLAPAAALLSTAIAGMLGGFAGYRGGWIDRLVMHAADLFASVPWLFLFLIVRAMLPLNTAPAASLAVTFLLLALLGWPQAARIVRARARDLRDSGFIRQARAAGCTRWRILVRYFLPNLRPVLFAQVCIAIPVFVLGEASLGLLGLGVSDAVPTWGNLLRELESGVNLAATPWLLAPLLLIVGVVSCFQILVSTKEVRI